MPCTPKKTVHLIRQRGSDLLVAVKDNQPTLHRLAQEETRSRMPAEVHCTHEGGRRNRIEDRQAELWPLPAEWGPEDWRGLFVLLIRVTRRTELFDTRRGNWERPRQEVAYYLATTRLTAAQAAHWIRQHWAIENRLHHVRDVTLREDACRIRRNPALFALLRSFTLNILRANNEQNISQALYANALNFKSVLAYHGI